MKPARNQASRTLALAAGKFDKLEQVFEDRVHKSLNRLGGLTSKDVPALSGQVAELSAAVHALLAQEKRGAKPAAAKKTVARKPAAIKPVTKKPTARNAARRARSVLSKSR